MLGRWTLDRSNVSTFEKGLLESSEYIDVPHSIPPLAVFQAFLALAQTLRLQIGSLMTWRARETMMLPYNGSCMSLEESSYGAGVRVSFKTYPGYEG